MQWDIVPEILSTLIVVILLANSRTGNAVPLTRDKIFRFCLYYTLFCTALNILSTQTVYYANSIPLWLNMVINTGYFAFYPLLPLIFIMYILLYAYEFVPTEHRRRLQFFSALLFISMTIYLIVVFSNISTGSIFSFNQYGEYIRGPLNQFSLVVASIQITIALVAIWMERRYLDSSFFRVVLWLPALSLSIITLQIMYPKIILTGTAITLAMLSVYLNFQTRRIAIDSLTQYPNRSSFIQTIEQIYHHNRKALVLIVSLDDFKTVNDTYGQKRGNLFIKTIAEGLHELIPHGQVYRYGGDEFAVIINSKYDEDIAELIIKRFSSNWHVEGVSARLRASVATLHLPFRNEPDSDPLTLLDYAIRTAKNRGKGQIVHCDTLLQQTIRRKNIVTERLLQAIESNSLYLEYQPIYSVTTNSVEGVEALLRMHDAQLGAVSPAEFIPLAEELGIIGDLGRWVLEQVCNMLDQYRATGKKLPPISVNFSGLQFSNTRIVREILETIERYKLPPNSITIELTESTFIGAAYDEALSVMRPLIDRGITFHLDDFGTGYSNLAYMINLPFNCIKIDRSLLWDVQKSNRSHTLIESIITVVRSLGFRVIVEGVETEEQLAYLQRVNCDMAQGFYLSPPKRIEELFS